jgi:hypothetical protein
MTGLQARCWAYAAAAAGLIANALFIAFYVGFAIQHFTQPHGVTAILGPAADLPGAQRARVARTARPIAATMLCSGVVALTGLAISVDSVVWTGLIAGCLAWLSIPLWLLALGRALTPSRAALPIPGTAISPHRRET